MELVESVRDYGGDIKIFSSLHVSGERKLLLSIVNYLGFLEFLKHFLIIFYIELEQLTGIAAILRFPIPELEDESDGESDSDEDN